MEVVETREGTMASNKRGREKFRARVVVQRVRAYQVVHIHWMFDNWSYKCSNQW